MAFWYMDDGSLGGGGDQEFIANFATNGFNEKSIFNLKKAMKKFNIHPWMRNRGDGWRMGLLSEDSEKFFSSDNESPRCPGVSSDNQIPGRSADSPITDSPITYSPIMRIEHSTSDNKICNKHVP